MEAKQPFNIRIHLIDDNSIFRLIFDIMLSDFQDCELEVTTYENALDFLDRFSYHKVASNTVNILFVDINMPFMTGWELVEKLGKESPNFVQNNPVYIISSSASKSDRAQVKNYPFIVGYVMKPVNKQMLFSIIQKHLTADRP